MHAALDAAYIILFLQNYTIYEDYVVTRSIIMFYFPMGSCRFPKVIQTIRNIVENLKYFKIEREFGLTEIVKLTFLTSFTTIKTVFPAIVTIIANDTYLLILSWIQSDLIFVLSLVISSSIPTFFKKVVFFFAIFEPFKHGICVHLLT